MEAKKAFWCGKKLITIVVLLSLCFGAVVIGLAQRFDKYRRSRDSFSSLGMLLDVELATNSLLDGTITKLKTEKGFYFVFGTVNAKLGAPVIFRRSYGWDRPDCIKIMNNCYSISGDSPEIK